MPVIYTIEDAVENARKEALSCKNPSGGCPPARYVLDNVLFEAYIEEFERTLNNRIW